MAPENYINNLIVCRNVWLNLISFAFGKDEVPGPNPGSSSRERLTQVGRFLLCLLRRGPHPAPKARAIEVRVPCAYEVCGGWFPRSESGQQLQRAPDVSRALFVFYSSTYKIFYTIPLTNGETLAILADHYKTL